jgi:membrane protein implicated in regulation of membrane protease activity
VSGSANPKPFWPAPDIGATATYSARVTPWVIWLVAAAGLAVAEVLTLTFVLGLLAVAAALTAVVALAGVPVAAQIAVFAAAGAGLTLGVGPIARRHLRTPTALRTGVNALEGRRVTVTEDVTPRGGRVKVGGESWAARALDPTREIPAGTSVSVAKVDGATLVVYDTESL